MNIGFRKCGPVYSRRILNHRSVRTPVDFGEIDHYIIHIVLPVDCLDSDIDRVRSVVVKHSRCLRVSNLRHFLLRTGKTRRDRENHLRKIIVRQFAENNFPRVNPAGPPFMMCGACLEDAHRMMSRKISVDIEQICVARRIHDSRTIMTRENRHNIIDRHHGRIRYLDLDMPVESYNFQAGNRETIHAYRRKKRESDVVMCIGSPEWNGFR